MGTIDPKTVTRQEREALAILYCDAFPIVSVIDEFIVDTNQMVARKGVLLSKELFLSYRLMPQLISEMLDLGAGNNCYWGEFAQFTSEGPRVRGIPIVPVLITNDAINRDPSIQSMFFVDYTNRRLHGI